MFRLMFGYKPEYAIELIEPLYIDFIGSLSPFSDHSFSPFILPRLIWDYNIDSLNIFIFVISVINDKNTNIKSTKILLLWEILKFLKQFFQKKAS